MFPLVFMMLLPLCYMPCTAYGYQTFEGELNTKNLSVHIESLRTLHVQEEEGFMLVGSKDRLYNVSLASMEMNYELTVPMTPGRLSCSSFEEYDCENHVRAIFKLDEKNYMLCHSNLQVPMCKGLVLANDSWQMTSLESNKMHRVTPVFVDGQIFLHESAPEKWYVMTELMNYGSLRWFILTLRMNGFQSVSMCRAPGYTTGDGSTIRGRSSYQDKKTGKSTELILRPHFAGIFTSDNFAYFLYDELPGTDISCGFADEKSLRLATIGAVCRNDPCHDGTFETYRATRIFCSYRMNREKEVYFYLNEIRAIAFQDSLKNPTNKQLDDTTNDIIYGIFTSAENSYPITGICAFNLKHISDSFNSSFCDNPSNPVINIPDGVYPIDESIFWKPGYHMTSIVVDWNITGPDGIYHNVLFVSTGR